MILVVLFCIGLIGAEDAAPEKVAAKVADQADIPEGPLPGILPGLPDEENMEEDDVEDVPPPVAMSPYQISQLPEAGSQDLVYLVDGVDKPVVLTCEQTHGNRKDCEKLSWSQNGVNLSDSAQGWSEYKCSNRFPVPKASLVEGATYTGCHGVNVVVMKDLPLNLTRIEKKVWDGNKIRCIKPELAEEGEASRDYESQHHNHSSKVSVTKDGYVKALHIVEEVQIVGNVVLSCNNTKHLAVSAWKAPTLIMKDNTGVEKNRTFTCTLSNLDEHDCMLKLVVNGYKQSGPEPLSYTVTKAGQTTILCGGHCDLEGDIKHYADKRTVTLEGSDLEQEEKRNSAVMFGISVVYVALVAALFV